MEKRDEIKAGVQARVIEMLAEQVINDKAFESLKQELLEELLRLPGADFSHLQKTTIKNNDISKEEIKRQRIWEKELGFPFNENAVKTRLENLSKFNGGTNFLTKNVEAREAIDNVKAGKLPDTLKVFPVDNSYEPDLSEMIEKAQYNPLFKETNPIPIYNKSNEKKSELRSLINNKLNLNKPYSAFAELKLDELLDKPVGELATKTSPVILSNETGSIQILASTKDNLKEPKRIRKTTVKKSTNKKNAAGSKSKNKRK